MIDLRSCRVLVTPTSYAKKDPRLITELERQIGEVIYNHQGRPLRAPELVDLIKGVDGYIAGLDEINKNVIQHADRLKVIARYGVGVDAVDLKAAEERGIIVTNTPGANSASVAELAVALILSLARFIPEANQATKSGKWPRYSGSCLVDKTVGLLGFGSIGKATACRLLGFECQIIAYDPYPDTSEAGDIGVRIVPELEVISSADFLSLHLPLTPQTKGMIDELFLRKMKPGAFFINTSRGELVDEDALTNALDSQRIKGAALDVFVKQPPDAGSRLLSHPNLIATPHMGAHTDVAVNAMGWGALNDCLAVLKGESPQNRVV